MAQTDLPAKLVFYRATGVFGNSLHASIKIDGDKPVHKLPNNHFWVTEAAPGEHTIYGDQDEFSRTYRLESGKTYYFRVDGSFPYRTLSLRARARFRMVLVPADTADGELTGLKPEKQ